MADRRGARLETGKYFVEQCTYIDPPPLVECTQASEIPPTQFVPPTFYAAHLLAKLFLFDGWHQLELAIAS